MKGSDINGDPKLFTELPTQGETLEIYLP